MARERLRIMRLGIPDAGLNTKMHMAIDATGRLVAEIILPTVNVSDHTVAPELTADLRDTAAVGEKRYDREKHRGQLCLQGCVPCIPVRSDVKNTGSPGNRVVFRGWKGL